MKVKHILWLKKRVHTFVSDGELLGAFNASSKRRDRSSNLKVPIVAPILPQLLLVGVLGLLNRQLLLSTALLIGFLVSIILSSWKRKRVSLLDPKIPSEMEVAPRYNC